MPQVAKLFTLKEEDRDWLYRELVARGFGDIVALTAELNARLAEQGSDTTVGKTAVGKEAQRIKRLQENIRATTEAARLIADTHRDDADMRGEALMAVVQTDIWEAMLQLREAGEVEDPLDRIKALTRAGTAVGEMSRARVNQSKWRAEVDAKVQAAAEKVTKLARTGGLDEKTAAEIRASILGITQRQQHAAAPPAA
jgi:hypothetical protein